MKAEDMRFMWVMVFFDLPTKTKSEKKAYTAFRRDLLKDGFMMLQFSVYARMCKGDESSKTHIRRVRRILPPKGSIRTLTVTDKQFSKMELMLGEKKKEESLHTKQLVLL